MKPMKTLSLSVAVFGLLALAQPVLQANPEGAFLGVVTLLCAYTTFRSTAISSFLKILVGIFSHETVVFALAVVAGRAGAWPLGEHCLPPDSLPLTVAIFWILVYLAAQTH